jgi:hypothetical protein
MDLELDSTQAEQLRLQPRGVESSMRGETRDPLWVACSYWTEGGGGGPCWGSDIWAQTIIIPIQRLPGHPQMVDRAMSMLLPLTARVTGNHAIPATSIFGDECTMS